MTGKRFLSFLFALLLIVTAVIPLFACGEEPQPNPDKGNPGGGYLGDPVCKSVTIKSYPTRSEYNEGEVYDPKGLVFDALFDIDGEDELIENMTYADCTYTYRGQPLTGDVTEIKFNCFSYEFTVSVTVLSANYTGITVSLPNFKPAYFVDTPVDLSALRVVAQSSDKGDITLNTGSYKLFDNEKEITVDSNYILTAGEHTFKVTFRSYEKTLTTTAYNEADVKVSGISVDPNGINVGVGVQDYVNLTRMIVNVDYTLQDGTETDLKKAVTGWTIKLADNTEIEDLTRFQIEESTTNFIVSYGGMEVNYALTGSFYDALVITRRDGTTSRNVTKGSSFTTTYLVQAVVTGTTKVAEVPTAEVVLKSVKSGVTADTTNDTVFDEAGELSVIVGWRSLSTTVECKVLDGYTVFTKDFIQENGTKSEVFDETRGSKYYIQVGGGKNAKYCNDNGYDYAGDLNNDQITLTVHFWSEAAGKANLVMNASSACRGNTEIDTWKPTTMLPINIRRDNAFRIYKDAAMTDEIVIDESVVLPGFTSEKYAYADSEKTEGYYGKFDSEGRAYDPMCWTAWKPVSLGTIDIVEGDNIIVIAKFNSNKPCNVYSIEIQLMG